MAHRPYGSIQDRMYPSALCCTGGLPSGFLFQRARSFMTGPLEQGKGEKLAPQVRGGDFLPFASVMQGLRFWQPQREENFYERLRWMTEARINKKMRPSARRR